MEIQTRLALKREAYEKARQTATTAAAKAEELLADLAAYERIAEDLRGGAKPKAMVVAQPPLSADGRINKTDVAYEIIAATGAQGAVVTDLDSGFLKRGLQLQRNYLFNITSRLKQQGRIDQRGKRYFAK